MTEGNEAIAIVGMAARVPGAEDVEEFWANLVGGRESVIPLDEQQLLAAGVPTDRMTDPRYVPAAAGIADVECFDAGFFGLTPRDAAATDPQIRLFLEVAYTALEDAGYDPSALDADVGVFASVGPSRYAELHAGRDADLAASVQLGLHTLTQSDYIATTAAYRLDLRGPSLTVLTACSSSLVALHLACQALRAGDCEMALVGGCDVEFPVGAGYQWTEGGILSPDGHCRPFDAEANGTVFGSGAAAVLIKPLADARADGDRIPAVVLGSAVNNDGSDKVSFGAPSLAGQASVIADALVQAGVAPAEVGYVEAHGTGTLLGDPVEVAALAEAYAAVGDGTARAEPTWLGSVKGNVGHLGPLAGMAGLVKAALALDREQLPPTANLREPNPRLRLAGTPFALLRDLRDWPRDPAAPRRAAVSSLGIGGTNAHVVLGEGPPADPPAPDEQWQLLVWSGRDERAADAVAGRLAAALGRPGTGPLADVAATLQHGRAALPVRRALVARDRADALAALTDPAHMARAVAGRGLVLPGPLADERAGFAALAQRCPRYAQAVDKWLAAEPGAVPDEWEGAAPWTAAAAVGARVALGRVWLEAGADPATLTGIGPGQVAADLLAGRNAGPPVATGPAPADLLSGHPVATEPAPDDLRRRHLAALGELWTSGADLDWDSLGCPPPRRRAALPGYPFERVRHWLDPSGAVAADQPRCWVPGWRDATAELMDGTDQAQPPRTALVVTGADPLPARAVVAALQQRGTRVLRLVDGAEPGRRGDLLTAALTDEAQLRQAVTELAAEGQWPDLVVHACGTSPAGPGAATIAPLLAALAGRESPGWLTVTRGAVDVSGATGGSPAVASVALAALRAVPGSAWLDLDAAATVESVAPLVPMPAPVLALRGRRLWVPERVGWPGSLDARPRPRRGRSYLVVDADGRLAAAVYAAGLPAALSVLTTADPDQWMENAGAEPDDPAVTVLPWDGSAAGLPVAVRAATGGRQRPSTAVLVGDGAPAALADAVSAALGEEPIDLVVAVHRDGGAVAEELAWRESLGLAAVPARDRLAVTLPGDTDGDHGAAAALLGLLAGRAPDHVVVTR
jgi:acyl transferase domain-containing protein